MQEEKEKRELPGALKTLAGVAIVFLLLAAVYVFYQAMQVLFPPNTYETALLATVEDTVDAEGVLLWATLWPMASASRRALRWRKSTAMLLRPVCASS